MSARGPHPGNADQVRQFTVQPDDEGVRLDRWFKRHLPQVGFATVSRWARTGQIRVDGKRADPADRLSAGQVLRVPPGGNEASKSGTRPKRELTEDQIALADSMVIHRDRSAIVLNKPPGLATQGGSGTYEHVDGLLDAYVQDGPRPRLVHRLDKDTSGVLLIAATPGSAAFFSRRFSGRSARKIYWALVVGVPSIGDGLIELPLAKQPGTGGEKMMVDESEHGQPARTRYRVVDRAGNRACWVELQPLTGRTHQLRVHMAAIGHPIVGDGKYGGQEAFLSGSISRKMHLHARRLLIEHPDGAPLDVTAELPEHFANSMAQLGFDEALGADLPEAPRMPEREAKKAAAKAHAKQYRKERRGERRKRADGGGATARPPSGQRARSGPPKPPAKSAGAKSGGAKPGGTKPAARPGTKPPAKSGPRPGAKPAGRPAPRQPGPKSR
ncbi:RluA family pseudouridine synthase [Novosphingobium flavum]|uniref:Ribosomal large subunit pseudouridine synthase D n=1 Tax=Novosphingobium aerophilum TaxID=2839843 RepID=A0A7X1F897_9SPHN|nr:RluA family pseudouridine synthase [Novosphingobium aerophilum]MBC2652238.1 RluA family pseudouridine synthase [Novosphingobium aerophilum]MBC2662649.1 RluA family pseudouridine synthase [Novosphingobium aerophilum]